MKAEKHRLLIIFAKNVEPGHVKTRLAADVGDEKATRIYRMLLKYTHKVAVEVGVDRQIWYDRYIPENSYFPKNDYTPRIQQGEGLGERMKFACKRAYEEGYQQVVIIGTDCPELNVRTLQRAFEQLETHDVVIGPAKDGGYYLLGMNQLFGDLFEDKEWSTPRVYEQTIKALEKTGLDWYSLDLLQDVDRWEDWIEMRENLMSKGLSADEL